mmetsp:Transcript_12944/g.28200  ORF Transcript_12944/g.28200 Transcript_12944/m.28200 type:complete len:115 (+) Transcript_12944:248-592(+)
MRRRLRTALAVALSAAALDRRCAAQPTRGGAEPEPAEHGPEDRFTAGTTLLSLFKKIDLDGDRRLDEHEVKMYFASMGHPVQEGLWENEDKDGDGFIELHEFVKGPIDDSEGEL